MSKLAAKLSGKVHLCTTCGERGDCGATIPKCANCWEVERRLESYLKTPGGRTFVRAVLEQAEKE